MRLFFLAFCSLLLVTASWQTDENTYPSSRRSLQQEDNTNIPLLVKPTVRAQNSTAESASESTPVTAPLAGEPVDSNNENVNTGDPSLLQACQSARDDGVYGTRNSFVVTYIFELETTSDPILESRAIQTKMNSYLLKALMLESGLCDEYLNGDRKLVQVLEGLLGVGSASYPTILSMNCQDNSDSTNCFRMMGSVVLYFDESIPSISYKGIKDTVLPLIYNNDIDLGSNGLVFRPEEPQEEPQPDTQSTVSGVQAPKPEVSPQRQSWVGPVGIVCAIVLVFCFTVCLGYLILRKYFVVIPRSTTFNSKERGASDDVSSIGVTQVISPQSSNSSEYRERYTANSNRALGAQVELDDVSSDEEQPYSPYDIRIESTSESYPEMSAHEDNTNDRQRKQYVRRQRELNRPKRKKSKQGYLPDTVEL